MTKSKKMYNKSFIQAQATEMAKAAVCRNSIFKNSVLSISK